MKGDFSKQTFDPEEHFHDVLMQQGRVFLDQDWNEQTGITGYRSETTARDIIGVSGGPLNNGGFKIESFVASPPSSPPSGDLTISAGHYYVDGILCENEEDIAFENQPDFPGQVLPTVSGNYQLYLDVWLLHITATEDNGLREVALGGPDTTTRTKVIWQIKCSQISDTSPITPLSCAGTDLPAETLVSGGTLSARSEPTPNTDDPCGIAATGGYRRLQNQLYRVEIHKGSEATGGATYKWSRDNGSIIVNWQDYDLANPAELKVSSLGKDELSGFNSGDWIEIIDNTTDLLIQPGILARISKSPQNNIITVDTSTIIFPDSTTTAISFADKTNPRIRRWDSFGDLPVNANTWEDLEDGVQIMLSGDSLKTGDYWTIPARTATADVEWPKDAGNTPVAALPFGIKHHYAKLAVASFDTTNGWTVISDCRNLFPPLTELTALYYVGGDGQEATPGSALPEPLMVGVASGSWAVSGAKVLFEIISGGGTLDAPPDGIVVTGVDGIAKCQWTPGDGTNSLLQVRASLRDDAGNLVLQKLPVIFSAGFSVANNSKKCAFTVGAGGDFETLQAAFDKTGDQRILCLCLLPQPHQIGNLKIEGRDFIKITGCGATLLMGGSEILIQSKTIVLHGLNVQVRADASILTLMGNDIYADFCSFTSPDSEIYTKRPFILIQPFQQEATDNVSVHWNSNQIFLGKKSIGVALALGEKVGGWIENSIINGTLLLQYSNEKSMAQVIWTPDIDEAIKKNFPNIAAADYTGQLLIRNNIMINIITSDIASAIRNKTNYATMIISENIFQKTDGAFPEVPGAAAVIFNNFFSRFINLVNNQFIEDQRQFLIQIACQRNVITGNIGANDNIQVGVITGVPLPTVYQLLNNTITTTINNSVFVKGI